MTCKNPVCEKPARPRSDGRGRTPVYCSDTCRVDFYKGRTAKLKYKYGLTVERYDQMLAEQDGACAICGGSGPEVSRFGILVVDHDHATGEIRGLLCSNCNSAIGLLGDHPETVQRAADYLAARALQEGVK